MRAGGASVRREPISSRELARLINRPRADYGFEAQRVDQTARRIDDATLVELAELPTAIACECRRHVAEIVMKLVGFETARSMFEQALAQIVADESPAVPALARSLAAMGAPPPES